MLDDEYKGPLTSLVEPSFFNNTNFIHAGAEDCLGMQGAADKLMEIVETVPVGPMPDCGSDDENWRKNKTKNKKPKENKQILHKNILNLNHQKSNN